MGNQKDNQRPKAIYWKDIRAAVNMTPLELSKTALGRDV